jgi:hypothetical protein
LALVSELTLRKRKLYEHIWHKESALCTLKKIQGKEVGNLYDVDSGPLMENLSSSFSVEAARFLAAVLGTVDRGLRAGGGIFICLSLNIVPDAIPFSIHYSPSYPDNPCNVSCILFHLGQESMLMCFMQLNNLCRKCLIEIDVSCLMKWQPERTYISIRNWTALRVLRIVEVRTGLATLQIMLCSS